ncbi:xanthine dehydrogenase family protein subunit M [Desulfosporosinus burensis]
MRFKLLEPTCLTEAREILMEQDNVAIMAGGTDLLVKIKAGLIKPSIVLSLHKVPGLSRLEYCEKQGLRIGPLVTHAQVARNTEVKERYSALAKACSLVGSPQIRNLGSVVGNLANASPAADTAPALLALRSELILFGPNGRRCIGLNNFFKGPGLTVLERGEVIEELIIPEQDEETLSTYCKIGRRKALEIAICGVALVATPRGDYWRDVSLGLGAVGPTPILAIKASALLESQPWTESLINESARIAASQCLPIDDLRASADYRRAMIKVLVQRNIRELILRREKRVNA